MLQQILILQYYVSNYGHSRRNFIGKLYQELGFESLQQRHWCRKLCCLFKIINNQSPKYLFPLVPSPNTRYFARNSENIPQLFKNMTNGWNNLDLQIRKYKSISIFKSNTSKFIWPKPNNVYYCHNPKGIRLITRFCLGLKHLHEHKFK